MTLELEDAKIAQPVRDTLDLALCPDGCGGRVCARCGHPPAQHYSERDRKRGTPEAVGSCALCLVLRGVASSCLGGPT